MYSISRKEFINPDMEMVGRIIDKLNEKFDPTETHHHSNADSEMFEFHYKTDGMKRGALLSWDRQLSVAANLGLIIQSARMSHI